MITDLFVFPVDAAGKPAFPFDRTDGIRLHDPDVKQRPELAPEQLAQIKALVVILCVRRALTQTGSLNLKPYAYRVHMDTRSKVSYDDTPADLDDDDDAAEGMGYVPVVEQRRQVTGQECVHATAARSSIPRASTTMCCSRLRLTTTPH